MISVKSVIILSVWFIFLLLSCQSNTGTKKPEWAEYGRNDDTGTVWSYDKNNVRKKTRGVVQVWEKIESLTTPEASTTPVPEAAPAAPSGSISHEINLLEIDCKERTIKTLSKNSRTLRQPKMEYILPGTVMDDFIEQVCK